MYPAATDVSATLSSSEFTECHEYEFFLIMEYNGYTADDYPVVESDHAGPLIPNNPGKHYCSQCKTWKIVCFDCYIFGCVTVISKQAISNTNALYILSMAENLIYYYL